MPQGRPWLIEHEQLPYHHDLHVLLHHTCGLILDASGLLQREVFAKLGVSSLEELGLEDWSQLLSPGSPNSVSGFHHFEGSQQVTAPANHDSSQPEKISAHSRQLHHQGYSTLAPGC